MDIEVIKCSETHVGAINVFYRCNMEHLLESTCIKCEMKIDMYACKLYKVMNNCCTKSRFTWRWSYCAAVFSRETENVHLLSASRQVCIRKCEVRSDIRYKHHTGLPQMEFACSVTARQI